MAAKDLYKKPMKIVSESKSGDTDGNAGRSDKTRDQAEKTASSGEEQAADKTEGAEPGASVDSGADTETAARHVREVADMHERHQDERADMHARHEKEHSVTLKRQTEEMNMQKGGGEAPEGKSGSEPA